MIGAGNLATNFSKALSARGHDIVQVYSRTMASARLLADAVGALPTDSLEDITIDAELYVMAVKDSVLAKLIPTVCSRRPDAVFVHTAGSVPMDVFAGHARRYGVVYPMQTFSKSREVDFSVIPIFLEAVDNPTMVVLEDVAKSVSADVRHLNSEARCYVHLAAVFACNFVNHCYALAADMVERGGMTFDCLLPLIDETARKVHVMSPSDAQTGPAVRYDLNVIGRQCMMLDDSMLARDIYIIMSQSIHQKSKRQ